MNADPDPEVPPSRRPGQADQPSTAAAEPPSSTRRSPAWAKVLVAFGAVAMVLGGVGVVLPKLVIGHFEDGVVQVPILSDAPQTIDGPINMLLLGMDERTGAQAEGMVRADSIVIVHIPASHDRAFLVSIPRDTEVAIPPFPDTRYPGDDADKINAAFAFGAKVAGGNASVWDRRVDTSPEGRGRGAALTAMTIDKLVPGGLRFNAVVVLNYDGFLSILNVLGPVEMCVDTPVHSIHFDAQGRAVYPDLPDGVGYYYKKGCYEMQPWQALDFSRQRHGLADSDYGRQRHQQQLIKAIVRKATSAGVLTNLPKLLELQRAAGNLLTLDLGGVGMEEWIYTLSGLRSDDLVMVKTNGGRFYSVGAKDSGNQTLSPDSLDLLGAVSKDTVIDFLQQHPDWVAADQ